MGTVCNVKISHGKIETLFLEIYAHNYLLYTQIYTAVPNRSIHGQDVCKSSV